MPYRFIAYTEDAEQVRGTIEARSEGAVEQALWQMNYFIAHIKAVGEPFDIREQLPSIFGIKTRDVIIFTRQLATLVNSGVGMLPALSVLREQVTNLRFRKVLREIIHLIETGTAMSEALRRYPQVFPSVYGRMVEVGERTGNMEQVLDQIATYMEKEQAILGKIRGAMGYPILLFILAIGVVLILVTFALPAMVGLFSEFNAELPWTTQFLINVTEIGKTYRLQFLLGVALVAALYSWYSRTPTGTRQLHFLLLKLPVIGPINLRGNMASLNRTMSILLRAGLPLPEIMDLLVQTTHNVIVREALQEVRTGLLRGMGLSVPMNQQLIFPKMLVQMIRVGEDTGTLDNSLATLADFYEKETDRAINNLTSKIEPTMIIFIGLVVGFIAIAVITPMYSIIGKIG